MFRSPDHFPPRQMAANRLIWLCLVVAIGIDLAMLSFLQLTLVIAYKPLFIYLFSVCAGISLFYRYVVHEKALFMLGECIAQIILASFVMMVTASLGTRLGLPLADSGLNAVDHFIGFAWQEHARWLAESPEWLNRFFKFCYDSYGAQLALLVPVLFFYHHSDYGQRLALMFLFAGLIASLLATLAPAAGAYAYLSIVPETLAIQPSAPLVHMEGFIAMREGQGDRITYPSVSFGTFPSLHAILAVMLVYASIPLERLRWLVIALNICMSIATLYHGGDYLISVVVGIVVGFLSIYWAERVLPPRSQAYSNVLNQVATETEKWPFSD